MGAYVLFMRSDTWANHNSQDHGRLQVDKSDWRQACDYWQDQPGWNCAVGVVSCVSLCWQCRKLQLFPFEHCPMACHCQQSPCPLTTWCCSLWLLIIMFDSILTLLASKFLVLRSCSILLLTIVFNLWESSFAFSWWITKVYNSNTVFNFSESRILNLYRLSRISSGGTISFHLVSEEPQRISRHNQAQNRWRQWPGSCRRLSKRSAFREGIGLLFEPSVTRDWPSPRSRSSGWSCSGMMQFSRPIIQSQERA